MATEHGKCIGTTIVNYKIARRNINDVNAAIELDADNDPVVKLTLGEMVLTVDVDYTVAIIRDDTNEATNFVIEGIGNFEDRLQIVLDDEVLDALIEQKSGKGFDLMHLLWIIPLGVIAIGGIAVAMVAILKKKKRGEAPQADAGSDANADPKEQE